MKWLHIVGFVVLSAVAMTSCKSKRGGTTEGNLKKRSAKYVFEKLDKYQIDAKFLDAKANVKFTQSNSTNTATAYIRMQKDEAIWVSVRKFGFEGGRLYVTPDSVFLLNRLDKTYIAESFRYIQDRTGLQSTGDRLSDFRSLYDLIMGNMVMKQDGKYKSQVEYPNYILSKTKKGLTSEYVITGNNFTLEKQTFKQDEEARRASCFYGNYKKVSGGYLFSYFRDFNLYSEDTGAIKASLNFSKVKLNQPNTMKFSIPNKYERVR